MGFERVVYQLTFDDKRWADLEVRCRGVTFEEAMDLQHLLNLGKDLIKRDDPVAAANRERYFDLLATIVIDWNRTDDGEPVPPDAKHMALEEMPMLQAMTTAYLRGVFEVAPPLPQPSSDIEPSEELFRLVESASTSPES